MPVLNAYQVRGRESQRVRDANGLPLGWDLPEPAQISRFLAMADQALDRRRTSTALVTREVVALILLALQTGADETTMLRLTVNRRGLLPVEADLAEGLWQTSEGGFIVLARAGAAGSDSTMFRQPSRFVVLPQTSRLMKAVEILADEQHQDRPLFRSPAALLLKKARQMMAGGRINDDSNKATRSLAAAGRWLNHRLSTLPGGDPAFALGRSATDRSIANTLSHYVSVEYDRFWAAYRTALEPIDRALPARPPSVVERLAFGSGKCPTDKAAAAAFERLRIKADAGVKGLQGKRISLTIAAHRLGPTGLRRDHHVAMMAYTFALLTFATGQRHTGHLVDVEDVDPEIHGAWINEKARADLGIAGSRGIFLCREAVEQLQQYNAYLDHVEAVLKKCTPMVADDLTRLRKEAPGMFFFDIVEDEIRPLSAAALLRMAKSDWPFPPRAGRRWIRSFLAGRIPADAQAAQFGHFHDGLDPWGKDSGLDPTLVRNAITRACSSALKVLSVSPIKVTRISPLICRDTARFDVAPVRETVQASRLVACAMWHGALLNVARGEDFINQARKVSSSTMPVQWLELSYDHKHGGQRWHTDPRTLAMLRQSTRDKLAVSLDKPLERFLGVEAEPFRLRCERRWRLRLPPILFALASGEVAYHGLNETRFRGVSPKQKQVRRPQFNNVRDTGRRFYQFLLLAGVGRRQTHPGLARMLCASLRDQPFCNEMTQLELSLAVGLISTMAGSQSRADRLWEAGDTIDVRAERLWLYFIPPMAETWESKPINDWSVSEIQLRLHGFAPHRANIADDLKRVFAAMPLTETLQGVLEYLQDTMENYTAETLLPAEYMALAGGEIDLSLRVAFALCYRCGIRFAELGDIRINLIRQDEHGGVGTIVLDHRANARLKTMHSRRRIPVDVLLDANEREDLASFVEQARAAKSDFLFPDAPGADDGVIRRALDRAAGGRMSVYPLRHAAASNALAAILWPRQTRLVQEGGLDPHLIDGLERFRTRICGNQSLGVTGPYAVAFMLGHTTPWRTLYSYAHNLEVALAAHVDAAHGIPPQSVSGTRPCDTDASTGPT